MRHKQKEHISAITAAVLFALAVSVFIALSHSFITFTGVQNVRYADGMIYGVNINRTRNEIFAMDADTGAGQFLKINQMGRDGVASFPALEVSDDGTVYLVRERYRDGNVNAMDLVRWNLEKNRLESVMEIPYTGEGDLTGFAVKEDHWDFLYYAENSSGNASEKAYEMTADGQYYMLDSTDDIEWDNGISGVSISSLPFKGVRQRTAAIVTHIVLLMLIVLAAEILFLIFGIWWKSGPRKYRSLIRMVGFTTAAFVLLVTAFNIFMRTAVFAYVSNHTIYSCEVEAEVLAETVNKSFLDNLANGSIDADSPEGQHVLGNHWNLFTGVVVYRGNTLVLEGDLFHHGRSKAVLNGGSLKELADEVLQSGEKKSTIYAARRGVNALVLQPVKTESGAETVICVRAPMRQALYEAYMIRKHITGIFYAMFAGILFITIAQLLWCLAPLGKLRRALDELAAGKLEARANVKGHNELAYAAKEFNRLADQLEKKQGGADLYRHFYESFLPMNLLRKVTDEHFQSSFEAGASAVTEAFLLSLRMPDSVARESLRCRTLLSSLVQIAEEGGGSVAEFRNDGFAAVFTGSFRNALLCALKLQRKTQEETGKNAFMGMNFGEAEVFVAGCEQRREIDVEMSQEADILTELSKLLGNALIVSCETLALRNAEESGFHFRRLGRMSLGAYSPLGELYALTDAELPDVRRKRERTLSDFENGVRAYASGDCFTAREQMIRCLLVDPDDRTARSYCLNCERKEPPAICEALR